MAAIWFPPPSVKNMNDRDKNDTTMRGKDNKIGGKNIIAEDGIDSDILSFVSANSSRAMPMPLSAIDKVLLFLLTLRMILKSPSSFLGESLVREA